MSLLRYKCTDYNTTLTQNIILKFLRVLKKEKNPSYINLHI